MKFSVFTLTCLLSFSANAVPRGIYLASPKKIQATPDNKVNLYLDLNCKNEFPDEWAGQLISTADDEGDMAFALAIVLSESSCDKGPKKQYTFTYELSQVSKNLTYKDIIEKQISLVPADIRN